MPQRPQSLSEYSNLKDGLKHGADEKKEETVAALSEYSNLKDGLKLFCESGQTFA